MCQSTVERLFDRILSAHIRKVASLFAQALNQSNGEVVQINIETACSSPKRYRGINPGTYTFIVSGRDSSNQLFEPYEVQFEVIE
jgi:hypothetical protein